MCKVIDKTETDIHHIISRKLSNKFNIKGKSNLIRIPRRKHVALNNFYWDKQTPKEQLKEMLGIWQTALSEWVRQQLYGILDLPDDIFYNEELIKHGKKKTKNPWLQWNSNRSEVLKIDSDWYKEMNPISQQTDTLQMWLLKDSSDN